MTVKQQHQETRTQPHVASQFLAKGGQLHKWTQCLRGACPGSLLPVPRVTVAMGLRKWAALKKRQGPAWVLERLRYGIFGATGGNVTGKKCCRGGLLLGGGLGGLTPIKGGTLFGPGFSIASRFCLFFSFSSATGRRRQSALDQHHDWVGGQPKEKSSLTKKKCEISGRHDNGTCPSRISCLISPNTPSCHRCTTPSPFPSRSRG